MNDLQIRAALERHWTASAVGDQDAEHEVYHDDPFSTLVIVCELTGDLGLVAPALGVCVGCYLLSGRDSLFDSQPVHRTDAPVQDSSGCLSK